MPLNLVRRDGRICKTIQGTVVSPTHTTYRTACGEMARPHTKKRHRTRAALTCLACIADQPSRPSQFINSNFTAKLLAGDTKDAESEGTAFIRKKLREESFTREIIEPVMLTDEEIERDEDG